MLFQAPWASTRRLVPLTPPSPDWWSGGSLSLAGGQVNGDDWVGGATSSVNYGTFTVTGDMHYGSAPAGHVNVFGTSTALHGNPLPIDFSSAVTSLTQLSNALNNMAANGTVTGNASNYTLTTTNCTAFSI